MALDQAHLEERLRELCRRHPVPGAAVAVGIDGEVVSAAHGVLSMDTGVEVTTDSIFQIGSITKPYTATVIMRLVASGALALDQPIVDVLPEFRVADPAVTGAVTVGHLLSHTGGIGGDFFPDLGRGDDVLERFVADCAELTQDVPLGTAMSYSNSGFVILGRVIERVTGRTWDEALRVELFEPLGLQRTVTLPEQALRHRAAWGHAAGDDGGLRPVPGWGPPRSVGPAGLICASAAEVVAFAQMHLDGGRSATGQQVLPAELVAAMQAPRVRVPEPWSTGDHWGLGWCLQDWGGQRLYGHDGSTIGQNAFLKIVPEGRLSIALLTNGGAVDELARALYDELLTEICGFGVPPLPRPAADGRGADERIVGHYERSGVRTEIERHGDEVRATTRLIEPLAAKLPDQAPSVTVLEPAADHDDVYVSRPLEGDGTAWPMAFFAIDGHPYLHSGARALRKVG